MFISADDLRLQYSGRIDFKDPRNPKLVYPSSYVKTIFTGTSLKAVFSNRRSYWNNYLGCIIDGKQSKKLLPQSGKVTLELANGLDSGKHTLLLFKRMDSCHMLTFHGLEVDDGAEIFAPEEKPKRKIEVYGDSVSAGEVSEAVDYVGKPDPEHQGEYSNSWYSYAWMTARKLNAQIHNISQGGIALIDGTGWFGNSYMGMESVYDKIEYNPDLGLPKTWDFSLYRPHVVIIAIAQNDSHPEDYMKGDYNCEKAVNWRAHYKDFVRKIRSIYPKAVIILATTILEHDKSWDKSIEQVKREINDKNVYHFMYSNNGCGTKGHIRIPEADKMSDELAGFINSLGENIWCDE